MIIKIIIHDYQISKLIYVQQVTGIKTCQGNSVSTASLFGSNLRQASVRSHSGNILLGLTGIPLMVKCHVLLKYDELFGIILWHLDISFTQISIVSLSHSKHRKLPSTQVFPIFSNQCCREKNFCVPEISRLGIAINEPRKNPCYFPLCWLLKGILISWFIVIPI